MGASCDVSSTFSISRGGHGSVPSAISSSSATTGWSAASLKICAASSEQFGNAKLSRVPLPRRRSYRYVGIAEFTCITLASRGVPVCLGRGCRPHSVSMPRTGQKVTPSPYCRQRPAGLAHGDRAFSTGKPARRTCRGPQSPTQWPIVATRFALTRTSASRVVATFASRRPPVCPAARTVVRRGPPPPPPPRAPNQ